MWPFHSVSGYKLTDSANDAQHKANMMYGTRARIYATLFCLKQMAVINQTALDAVKLAGDITGYLVCVILSEVVIY